VPIPGSPVTLRSTTRTNHSTLKQEMSNQIDDDAVAAADKEMEERANRAKELLSQRHRGLKSMQVCKTNLLKSSSCLFSYVK
jgi:hypothetical protein